jgi:predicted transcriptional regulator/rubredoxin
MAGKQKSPNKKTDNVKNKNSSNWKNENYLTVWGWMTNVLKLNGNKLLVYALINGFSGEFRGSTRYIATALNMSRRTVFNALENLTTSGLITKKEVGQFCIYSVVPMQNLHTTYENFAPNINIGINKDIDSGSSAEIPLQNFEPQTTTTSFINKCKSLGYSFDDATAQKITAGIDPSWLSGAFTYPEYIAGVILENYAEKPFEQRRKLFRSLLAKEDRKNDYPAWRENRETEAKEQHQRKEQEKADRERQRALSAIKNNKDKTCTNCGTAFEDIDVRGSCPSCGWFYSLDEEKMVFVFCEHKSLSEAFDNMLRDKYGNATEIPSEDIEF